MVIVFYVLSGDPLRMAEGKVQANASSVDRLLQLRESLLTLLPTLPVISQTPFYLHNYEL